MDFAPVTLEDYDRIYAYTSVYGEGSCQHSPVSMYSLFPKYGDSICIKDDILFVQRSRLCDDTHRVYLGPLCDDEHLLLGFRTILEDAASHGKKVRFLTLTARLASALDRLYPGRFEIKEERDLFEYIYKTEVMAAFAGQKLRKRRQEVARFKETYGERAELKLIASGDLDDILSYENEWIAENSETHDLNALKGERESIKRQLDHYDALKLSGVILRIDGKVEGFSYGTRLSDSFYDALIEKGSRSIPNVYKVLRQNAVSLCAMDCEYVNLEEDVGVPGLRRLKEAYQPAYLLPKYIVTEI